VMRFVAVLALVAACGDDAAVIDGGVGSIDDATPDGPPPILEDVHLIGRFDGQQRFGWPGTNIRTRFAGTEISIELTEGGAQYYEITIDGVQQEPLHTQTGRRTYVLATGLAAGEHDLVVARRTESFFGTTTFHGFPGATFVQTPRPTRLVEFIGDSITCGYGVLGAAATCDFSAATEAETRAWATLASDELGVAHVTIAYSGIGMYRNGDGSTTAVMPLRYDRILAEHATPAWDFSYTPDVIVINLGTNDFAPGDPGMPYVTATVDFVRTLKTKFPAVKVLLATSPMLGNGFPANQMHRTKARMYLDLAATMIMDPDVTVSEIAEQKAADGYGCDYHPNVVTNQKMAAAIVADIRRVTGWQ